MLFKYFLFFSITIMSIQAMWWVWSPAEHAQLFKSRQILSVKHDSDASKKNLNEALNSKRREMENKVSHTVDFSDKALKAAGVKSVEHVNAINKSGNSRSVLQASIREKLREITASTNVDKNNWRITSSAVVSSWKLNTRVNVSDVASRRAEVANFGKFDRLKAGNKLAEPSFQESARSNDYIVIKKWLALKGFRTNVIVAQLPRPSMADPAFRRSIPKVSPEISSWIPLSKNNEVGLASSRKGAMNAWEAIQAIKQRLAA